jgi:hypothetical protein
MKNIVSFSSGQGWGEGPGVKLRTAPNRPSPQYGSVSARKTSLFADGLVAEGQTTARRLR